MSFKQEKINSIEFFFLNKKYIAQVNLEKSCHYLEKAVYKMTQDRSFNKLLFSEY
jgi:hypothetical protein